MSYKTKIVTKKISTILLKITEARGCHMKILFLLTTTRFQSPRRNTISLWQDSKFPWRGINSPRWDNKSPLQDNFFPILPRQLTILPVRLVILPRQITILPRRLVILPRRLSISLGWDKMIAFWYPWASLQNQHCRKNYRKRTGCKIVSYFYLISTWEIWMQIENAIFSLVLPTGVSKIFLW